MHGILRGLGSQTCTCVWGPCPVLLATSPREGSHVASCRPVKASLRGSKATRGPSTESWGPQPGLAPQCCCWGGGQRKSASKLGRLLHQHYLPERKEAVSYQAGDPLWLPREWGERDLGKPSRATKKPP